MPVWYTKTSDGWTGSVDRFGDEFFAVVYRADDDVGSVIDLGSFNTSLAAIAAVDNRIAEVTAKEAQPA